MDAFSEILTGIKLKGALFFHAELSAPWGLASPASQQMAAALAPGAPHLVLYHFVADGEAFAKTEEGDEITLAAGDIVIFPHGDAHSIGSRAATTDPGLHSEVLKKVKSQDFTPLHAGGGGRKTRIVCGFMACDPHLGRPIFSGLPAIFKVNVREDVAGRWLESSILHLVDETASGRVGSAAMLAKLSEALFVDTLRRHIESLPEQQNGWLAGARDPVVGRSLGLLHSRIDHPWTIETLASEVGISRSALIERFTKYLSEPPMTYLTRWRLQLAGSALAGTSKGVAEIASEIGYESESAFNRAFKREFGLPPARYRRERRQPK